MAGKKKPKPDDPEQYARFVEVAEEHFDEEAEEKFEQAIKKILPVKAKETKRDNEE